MKTPVIFFGASSFVIPVIDYLHNDFDLKLVVTTEKEHGTVPTYCREHNIPCLTVTSLKDSEIQTKLKERNVNFAILADFGLLVPQSVIDIFPKGIINIHPSLLPIYRGPTPGMSTLLHGDTLTGISIMLLDKDLDHGPVIGQITSEIKPDDTSATLYPRLFEEGTTLLKKILPEYLEGKIEPQEQDHSKATFTEPHLTKETGYVDFDSVVISSETRDLAIDEISHSVRNDKKIISPKQLDQMIRAYFPWPTVWTRISMEGRLKGKIIKFLPEGKVQVEGKKSQSYKDFLNGYPEMKGWLERIVGK